MGIVCGVKGTIRARLMAVAAVMAMGATACGGGGADDVVALPSVPTGVLAAVDISLGDLGIESEQVDAGAGVFLVPRSRIVFADVSCEGDPDDSMSVRGEGELLETLQRARLQVSIRGDVVEPLEGDHHVLVGAPEHGLEFVSASATVDDGLVSVEGVHAPRTDRTPLEERLPGGSFRLVARCGT